MSKIIVLFNLKDGVEPSRYEAWARDVDLPTVSSLSSVDGFEVFATQGLLGGGEAPYRYIEIIDTASLDALVADIGTPAMQQVAAQFQEFADNPQFIVCEPLGQGG